METLINVPPHLKQETIIQARWKRAIHVLTYDPGKQTFDIVPLAGILAMGQRTVEFFGFPTTGVTEMDNKLRPAYRQ